MNSCMNAVCENKVPEGQRLCDECLQGKINSCDQMDLTKLKSKQEKSENKRSIIPMEKENKRNKYLKEIKPTVMVDVYDVLVAFNVTNPAAQHAIKKMLMPGKRGAKSLTQDYHEAIVSIQRAIEME